MLTSEEREGAIFELWESGNSEKKKDLGKLLGFSVTTIDDNLRVLKKVRDIYKSKILDLLKKVDKIKEELLYLQGFF